MAESHPDPANTIFHSLLDDEEAREAVVIEVDDHGCYATIRLELDHGDVTEATLLSVRSAAEFADDIEVQSKQEGWCDEAEPLLIELRKAISDAISASR